MADDIPDLLRLAALHHAAAGAAEIVFGICDVDDFMPGPEQDIASIVVSLMRDGPVDQMAVFHRCSQQSASLVGFYTQRVKDEMYGTPSYCANAVRDAANRRRALVSVTRAQQQLTQGARSVADVVMELAGELAVTEAHISSGLGVVSFDEIMATPDDSRPWVVPSVMRTNERMVITGPEGHGKSTLVAQVCMGAAMGVNTLDLGFARHDPMRVLMLDVENDRLQVRNNMRKIYPDLREMTGGQPPSIEWMDVRDIDLADAVERQKVIRLAKERMPQLLYLGSLYKLAPEGDRADTAFTAISRTVDRIRAETGTAVLLEGHTGHGNQNDRNGAMRPYGSSMWMRWPEFGIAMVPHKTSGWMRVKHWRGARSDDRRWPYALRRGDVMPWEPVDEALFESRWGLDD